MSKFTDFLKSVKSPTNYTVMNKEQSIDIQNKANNFDKQQELDNLFSTNISQHTGSPDFYKDAQQGVGFIGGTTRPGNPLPYLSTDTGAKVPLYPIPLIRLFEIVNHVPDVKTVFNVIQREMFKNGFTIEPKFQYKCKNCGKEFDKKPIEQLDEDKQKKKPDLQCDSCERKGEANFAKPDPYQRQIIDDLFTKSVNANKQNIEDIIRQFEFDLDAADNAYCLILKNYYLKKAAPNNDDAKLEIDDSRTEVSEILRVHPAQVAFIADADGRIGYDDNRNKVYVCPDFRHRNIKLVVPVCKECGARALPAVIEANTIFSTGIIQPKKVIYAEGELIWTSGKHTPDILYGYSPLISIWKKAMALFHMDEYILKYFDKQRPPRSLLIINSRNADGVKQFWEKQRQGAREDPFMPRPLLVDNEKGGAKNAVEHIDLVGKLTDLQFTEVREELRQALFAIYGFPPFLFGQVDKGGFGGANMQMTQVNRTIKASQVFLENKCLVPMVKAVGVTDWKITINDGEETDELRDAQLYGQKLDNAVKLFQDLGIPVWLDGNGEPQSGQMPDPKFIEALMSNRMNDRGDKSKKAKGTEEEDTKFGGEIHNKRPSDVGGSSQGDTNSGSSLNNKSLDDKVHYTLSKGVDAGWTQSHIAKEVRKLLPDMSYTEAYTFVKDTLKNGLPK